MASMVAASNFTMLQLKSLRKDLIWSGFAMGYNNNMKRRSTCSENKVVELQNKIVEMERENKRLSKGIQYAKNQRRIREGVCYQTERLECAATPCKP